LKNGFIIYGCYGYTGKLISELAVKSGLKPVLAGRDAARTKELAQTLNTEYRVFDVTSTETVAEQIKDFKIVLHCAGPFKFTSDIMARACLKAGTHYLDITGEYQVFEMLFGLNEAAVKAGILLMPGVGFDVVPTDCLSLFLKEQLPTAHSLEIALYQKGGRLSHGTALTVNENLGDKTMLRRNGTLQSTNNGVLTKMIHLDGKERKAVAISWGDISTAFRTTGISNITVYNVLPQKVIDGMKMSNYLGFIFRNRLVKNYLGKKIKQRPAGPSDEERKTATSIVWGEVKDASGNAKSAMIELPEGYTLTALTSVKIVERILQQEPPHGTHTPAKTFGADFILQFTGVKRTLLQG
jgi:short subunit dehydrogenase-like uncharacterized protein